MHQRDCADVARSLKLDSFNAHIVINNIILSAGINIGVTTQLVSAEVIKYLERRERETSSVRLLMDISWMHHRDLIGELFCLRQLFINLFHVEIELKFKKSSRKYAAVQFIDDLFCFFNHDGVNPNKNHATFVSVPKRRCWF